MRLHWAWSIWRCSVAKKPATSYIYIVHQIVGNPESWSDVYYWDGAHHTSLGAAINAGRKALGHDDFNTGRVEDGCLVWFGWERDHHEDADLVDIANQIGLAVTRG